MPFFSSLSARDWKRYLNALWRDERGWRGASEYALEVTYLTEQRASGSDTEAGPHTPDQATNDGQDFMTKELRDGEQDTKVGWCGYGLGGKI